MSLSTGGVNYISPTTDTTGGSDDDGDGSIWDSLFSNAGGILTGGAALLNAFNGKPATSTTVVNPGATTTTSSNMWLYVVIGVIVLVLFLFMILKK